MVCFCSLSLLKRQCQSYLCSLKADLDDALLRHKLHCSYCEISALLHILLEHSLSFWSRDCRRCLSPLLLVTMWLYISGLHHNVQRWEQCGSWKCMSFFYNYCLKKFKGNLTGKLDDKEKTPPPILQPFLSRIHCLLLPIARLPLLVIGA